MRLQVHILCSEHQERGLVRLALGILWVLTEGFRLSVPFSCSCGTGDFLKPVSQALTELRCKGHNPDRLCFDCCYCKPDILPARTIVPILLVRELRAAE